MGSDMHTQNCTCSHLDGINFKVQKYVQDFVKHYCLWNEVKHFYSDLMRKPQSTSYSAEVVLLCMEPKIGLWFMIKNNNIK
jgi:hypothetical protein